jgi:hypothetical protein
LWPQRAQRELRRSAPLVVVVVRVSAGVGVGVGMGMGMGVGMGVGAHPREGVGTVAGVSPHSNMTVAVTRR